MSGNMLCTGTLAATSTEEPGISGAPGSRPRRDSPLDWQGDTVALGEAGQIQPAAATKEAQSDRVAEGAALATRLPAWDGPLTGEQGESMVSARICGRDIQRKLVLESRDGLHRLLAAIRRGELTAGSGYAARLAVVTATTST